MHITNNLHKISYNQSFRAKLPRLSLPEKNIVESEAPEIIKETKKLHKRDINDIAVLLGAGGFSVLFISAVLARANLFTIEILGIPSLSWAGLSSFFTKDRAIEGAKSLGKDLKKSEKYTDKQRLIIIDKYLKKSGDFVFTPLIRHFNKKKVMQIAQVDPKTIYKPKRTVNAKTVDVNVLKAFAKNGWSKKETIKFVNALNYDAELPNQTLIEIAKELYNSTPHPERPLSNKIKAKIFKNITTPRSDDFDALKRLAVKK